MRKNALKQKQFIHPRVVQVAISAETSAVAERYANALFDLAREQNALDQVNADLERFLGLLKESEDLRRFVRSPVFSAREQASGLAAVLDRAQITGLAHDFLLVMAKNRRLFVAEGAIKAYRARLAIERGEIEADVTAAIVLSEQQRQALIDTLQERMGRVPNLNVHVDPSILGGLIVKVGSRMVDTSIRTKLNNLKVAMKEVG